VALLIVGVLVEIRFELEERLGALAGHREGRPDPNLHFFVVRPLAGGLVQNLERVVDVTQPEQCVAEQCEDERRLTLGNERQLPRADRFLIAIVQAGGDPSRFMGEVMAGVWARDDDMTRPEAIAATASATGFDAQALAAAAESEAVRQLYEATIGAAIEAGVFGAPSYVLDGEVFWGQDRLELLDSALASGRAPYRADPGA